MLIIKEILNNYYYIINPITYYVIKPISDLITDKI